MNNNEMKVALITGASSGIGLATTKALKQAGYRVFGTSRKAVASVDGIKMLICDVTSEMSVQNMVSELLQQTGRIDLLVNNAGIGLVAGAEESSTAQAQVLFDVNVFGIAKVTNAVLPTMRNQKGGRIINISSILGLIPAPYNALYAATKHAVEGYSESLDHELRNFGIRVVVIEPGFTRTAFEENITRPDRPLEIYNSERTNIEMLMRSGVSTGDSPEIVADAVVKAATVTIPKRRYTAGKFASKLRWVRRFLPEDMFDKNLRKFYQL